jgi:hypothetical protein
MRNILFILFLLAGNVYAMDFQQQVQEELKATPSMINRCKANILYYEDKIQTYEAKYPDPDDYNAYMNAKLDYYYDELESWLDYCDGEGSNPDF